MKTALSIILLTAGCALAQTPAGHKQELTVTDRNGTVLMTNANYMCTHMGRVFFNRGCCVEGFDANRLAPALLSHLKIDLNETAVKAQEERQRKEESDRAYRRNLENYNAWKALQDQKRREEEAAGRDTEEASCP